MWFFYKCGIFHSRGNWGRVMDGNHFQIDLVGSAAEFVNRIVIGPDDDVAVGGFFFCER
jgi:hypothetical protein